MGLNKIIRHFFLKIRIFISKHLSPSYLQNSDDCIRQSFTNSIAIWTLDKMLHNFYSNCKLDVNNKLQTTKNYNINS